MYLHIENIIKNLIDKEEMGPFRNISKTTVDSVTRDELMKILRDVDNEDNESLPSNCQHCQSK